MIGDERLLVRTRTASYAVPDGFPITVTHVGNCGNKARNSELVQCIRGSGPKVMTVLITAAKAVMIVMRCPEGCHINKDSWARILYNEHFQDSSFAVSSCTTAGFSTGIGSLVGERLIEGVQGTPSSEKGLQVGCVSRFSSVWPPGLSGLG